MWGGEVECRSAGGVVERGFLAEWRRGGVAECRLGECQQESVSEF